MHYTESVVGDLLKNEGEASKVDHGNVLGDLPILSFFTGAGFLDFGFESAGFETKMINEYHGPFVEGYLHGADSLNKKSKAIVHHCSIDEFLYSNKKLPHHIKDDDPVGFVGGPPCPDFSIGGKQKGRTGDNGKLTGSYVQLICNQKPSWFLLENVKGLWRTKKHREFYDEQCSKLIKSGYCLTNRLINSLEYGVPQDRFRIILLGFRAEIIGKKSGGWLDESEFPWNESLKYKMEDLMALPWPTTSKIGETVKFNTRCVESLTVDYWFRKNMVSEHLNSQHCFVPRAGLSRFKTILEGDDSRKSFKRLHRWRFSPTAAYGNNEVHIHPYEARRINVAEALSIQSLPKEYSLPATLSLSNMFKTVGNGVPYLAASGIANSVKIFLARNLK
jgi:DNA (cytosine-5)-methyltransferase 1